MRLLILSQYAEGSQRGSNIAPRPIVNIENIKCNVYYVKNFSAWPISRNRKDRIEHAII